MSAPHFSRYKKSRSRKIKDPTAPVKTRLISSYVKLNKYVQDVPTQLPVIREIITSLSSFPYNLGTADLQQTYRSFPLEEEATEYLALSALSGQAKSLFYSSTHQITAICIMLKNSVHSQSSMAKHFSRF